MSCSNTKKTRQAHQVTVCVLFDLLMSTFDICHNENADESIDLDTFLAWCIEQKIKKTHFEFWYSIMNFEILVLSFIRSLRESDFELYKETLSSLIPYFFGLDHVNYSRWLPIHLRDMVSLESKHSSINREFAKGNFTIRKSTTVFSNMAIDQAHEQTNAVVKDDGGAIGLTEDSVALRRWMVAGPEIGRLVGEFESSIGLGHDKL